MPCDTANTAVQCQHCITQPGFAPCHENCNRCHLFTIGVGTSHGLLGPCTIFFDSNSALPGGHKGGHKYWGLGWVGKAKGFVMHNSACGFQDLKVLMWHSLA